MLVPKFHGKKMALPDISHASPHTECKKKKKKKIVWKIFIKKYTWAFPLNWDKISNIYAYEEILLVKVYTEQLENTPTCGKRKLTQTLLKSRIHNAYNLHQTVLIFQIQKKLDKNKLYIDITV